MSDYEALEAMIAVLTQAATKMTGTEYTPEDVLVSGGFSHDHGVIVGSFTARLGEFEASSRTPDGAIRELHVLLQKISS